MNQLSEVIRQGSLLPEEEISILTLFEIETAHIGTARSQHHTLLNHIPTYDNIIVENVGFDMRQPDTLVETRRSEFLLPAIQVGCVVKGDPGSIGEFTEYRMQQIHGVWGSTCASQEVQ